MYNVKRIIEPVPVLLKLYKSYICETESVTFFFFYFTHVGNFLKSFDNL